MIPFHQFSLGLQTEEHTPNYLIQTIVEHTGCTQLYFIITVNLLNIKILNKFVDLTHKFKVNQFFFAKILNLIPKIMILIEFEK